MAMAMTMVVLEIWGTNGGEGRGMAEERQTMLLLRPIQPLCQVAGVVERQIARVVTSLRCHK
jgi:hypothetical protein